MSKSVVAKRYAIALFELSQKNGETSSIRQELLELKKVYTGNEELGQLLGNPKLTMTKKTELLEAVFSKSNPLIKNTLFVLLKKKRMNEIVNLVDAFNTLANDAVGVAEAQVYSTLALTAEESEAISSTFAKKIGKQSLRFENIIDPTLIGGVRLQIGNRIFDSSISGKLDRLKKDLVGF